MTICTPNRIITPWDLQVDTMYSALNPDGLHTYPANNTSLSSIKDLGKRSNDQTQSTGASQPTFIRNANNNFGAFKFSGSQWASCAAGSGNSYQGAMTILGIWQNNASGTQRILMKLLSWAYSSLGTNYNWNIWASASGVAATTTGNPVVSGVYQQCTMNYNRGTNASFYKNETFLQTITPYTSLNDAGTQNLYFGSRDGTQQFVNGAVQEILVFFRQLSTWELTNMHFWTKLRGNL